MTIEDQIKFIINLPNSAEKFRILDTLKMVKEHIPAYHEKAYVVGMSKDDYKSWLEYQEFKKFTNRPSQG